MERLVDFVHGGVTAQAFGLSIEEGAVFANQYVRGHLLHGVGLGRGRAQAAGQLQLHAG